jgi:hypothetical protein
MICFCRSDTLIWQPFTSSAGYFIFDHKYEGKEDQMKPGKRRSKKKRNSKKKDQQRVRNKKQRSIREAEAGASEQPAVPADWKVPVPSLPALHALTLGEVREALVRMSLFHVDPLRWDCDSKGKNPKRGGGPDGDGDVCATLLQRNQGRKCGEKAICFKSQDVAPGSDVATVKQVLDGAMTSAYVKFKLTEEAAFSGFLMTFWMAAERMLKLYAEVRGLSYGTDVFIYFKGGNALRMQLQRDVAQLREAAAADRWPALVGSGDMDFEVYLKDAGSRAVREASNLMLYTLYAFRTYLLGNDGQGLLRPGAEDVLAVVQADMPGVATVTAAPAGDALIMPFGRVPECNALYVPVPCVLRHKPPAGAASAGKMAWVSPRDDTPLFITHNTMLSHAAQRLAGEPLQRDLVLLRIKHRGKATIKHEGAVCTSNCDAEVIDVCIATNDDETHKNQIKAPSDGAQAWFDEVNVDGVVIRTPSIHTFTADLMDILFKLSERPWHDRKWSKRLQRLVWCCTVYTSKTDGQRGEAGLAQARTLLGEMAEGSWNGDPGASAWPWSDLRGKLRDLAGKVTPEEAKEHTAFLTSMGSELNNLIASLTTQGDGDGAQEKKSTGTKKKSTNNKSTNNKSTNKKSTNKKSSIRNTSPKSTQKGTNPKSTQKSTNPKSTQKSTNPKSTQKSVKTQQSVKKSSTQQSTFKGAKTSTQVN